MSLHIFRVRSSYHKNQFYTSAVVELPPSRRTGRGRNGRMAPPELEAELPRFGEQTFQWKDYFRWHCRVTRHVERLSLFNNNHSVLTYH